MFGTLNRTKVSSFAWIKGKLDKAIAAEREAEAVKRGKDTPPPLGGGDIYALSRHLGHSSVMVTDSVYGGWIRREDKAAGRSKSRSKTAPAANNSRPTR